MQALVDAGFACHELADGHQFFAGSLPDDLAPGSEAFDEVWDLHPDEYHLIEMHGRLVRTPRWQQAYGADYYYTGRVNRALPIPSLLEPLLNWCQTAIDAHLNGVLLNWYDASLRHYIGAHRDSVENMVEGAPIVTISLGAERVFRLRPWKGKGYRDFAAPDRSVFVTPYATNLAWTHEVPHFARYRGRRISVTLRGFVGA